MGKGGAEPGRGEPAEHVVAVTELRAWLLAFRGTKWLYWRGAASAISWVLTLGVGYFLWSCLRGPAEAKEQVVTAAVWVVGASVVTAAATYVLLFLLCVFWVVLRAPKEVQRLAVELGARPTRAELDKCVEELRLASESNENVMRRGMEALSCLRDEAADNENSDGATLESAQKCAGNLRQTLGALFVDTLPMRDSDSYFSGGAWDPNAPTAAKALHAQIRQKCDHWKAKMKDMQVLPGFRWDDDRATM